MMYFISHISNLSVCYYAHSLARASPLVPAPSFGEHKRTSEGRLRELRGCHIWTKATQGINIPLLSYVHLEDETQGHVKPFAEYGNGASA